MNAAAVESPPIGQAGTKPPDETSWSHGRWLMLIVLVFAAHVALLFVFGARNPIAPRPVKHVPMLKLADNTGGLLALNDPTLFALPHQRDDVSALQVPVPAPDQPAFHWTEPAGEQLSPAGELGTVFDEFMQTNRFADFELQLKPPLKLSAPGLPVAPVIAQTSTLQIGGDLVQRRLLDPINPPSWPYESVIAPSKVQAVVDPAGNVVSAVLLPADGGFTTADQYDEADQRALELTRSARFAPAPRLTVGRLIFNWHTVPVTATNEPGR